MKHSNTTLNGSRDRLWLSFKNALRVNSGPLIALVVIYFAGNFSIYGVHAGCHLLGRRACNEQVLYL